MESFLRDAERILDTAAAASERDSREYVICLSRTGSLRLLSDIAGWSLPALAAELGAAAIYRVGRNGTLVRVEGWSYGRECVLTKDSSNEWWSRPRPQGTYATLHMLEAGGSVTLSRSKSTPRIGNAIPLG